MKATAIKIINEIHSLDPTKVDYNGSKIPAELLYANQCTEWLFKLKPEASELEELAAKCQHFKRCCETREQPRTNGDEGVRVIELLTYLQTNLSIYRSYTPLYPYHEYSKNF